MSDAGMNNDIIQIFKQESSSNLTTASNLLLKIEQKGTNSETLKEIKRIAHTLKGDARMMGFKAISDTAHKLEDYFEETALTDSKHSKNIFKNIFKIIDILQEAINKLPQKIEINIKAFLHENKEDEKTFTDSENKLIENKTTTKNQNIESFQDKKIQEPENEIAEHPDKPVIQREYIQVSLDKLDEFLIMSSHISEYYGRFNFIYRNLAKLNSEESKFIDDDNIHSKMDALLYDFSHELTFYNILAKQFQEDITKLKLVPLSVIFDIFPRLVRDIAESTGKKINFVIHGGEVELDRNIVNKLKDILIHILRNAVDHGCENEEARIKANKPPSNKVILKAYNKGDTVLIEVSDDGHGLNISKIKEKAIQKGLVSITKAEKMTDDEIINFIFQQGFSTSDVGKFSGRGVGMDAVAMIIKQLNGNINVETNPGRGTSFILSVPLISSFIPVTLCDVQGTIFAIPSTYIVSAMYVDTESVHHVSDKIRSVKYNNMDIILIDLANFFNISQSNTDEYRKNRNILIVSHQDEITALIISNVIMEKKMIIERISSLKNLMPIIIGALLGSTHAIPVLNIPVLFKKLKTELSDQVILKTEKNWNMDHKLWQKKILLVEDSLVTRIQEKGLLEQQKIYVSEAANGKEALAQLKTEKPDMIITDIEMPIMNGLELIKQIKSQSEYSDIPIIVVSSYTRYFGDLSDLGIKYFVDKGEFKSDKIIKILKQEKII